MPKPATTTVITPANWQSGVLADWQIEQLCSGKNPMIHPFQAESIASGSISYGMSSYGYDVRLAPEFKLFTANPLSDKEPIVLDPKNFTPECYVEYEGPHLIIPPHGFALGRTVEYLKIPRDILVIALAKSTYARLGLVVGVTPLEPAFEGEITLELSNTTDHPVKVYADEGICQFLFFKGSAECEVSYADRGGKYMGQRGVTDARMKND